MLEIGRPRHTPPTAPARPNHAYGSPATTMLWVLHREPPLGRFRAFPTLKRLDLLVGASRHHRRRKRRPRGAPSNPSPAVSHHFSIHRLVLSLTDLSLHPSVSPPCRPSPRWAPPAGVAIHGKSPWPICFCIYISISSGCCMRHDVREFYISESDVIYSQALFSWNFFFEFRNCSTFIVIWQLISNHRLIRYKDSSRCLQLNCVISYFFPTTFNTSCICPKIRCNRYCRKKFWELNRAWRSIG